MPHLIALLLTLCCAISHAATITGKVVAVADGDTITVLDDGNVQHKIRLAGIDAPEKAQPFENKTKKSLADLPFGNIASFGAETAVHQLNYAIQTQINCSHTCARVSAQGVRLNS